jgi:hypothetical protein
MPCVQGGEVTREIAYESFERELTRVQGNGAELSFPKIASGNQPYRKKDDWIGKEKRGDRLDASYRDHVWQNADVIIRTGPPD